MLTEVEAKWIRKIKPKYNGEWGRPFDTSKETMLAVRVHVDVARAIRVICALTRRPVSTEVAIMAEEVVLRNESKLRAAGAWTETLDKIKGGAWRMM